MKILEFENTQGINLQFATASVVERIIGYLLDIFVIVIAILLLSWLNHALDTSSDTFLEVAIVLILSLYHILFESLNDGQSLGKMAVGLKVIRIDGRPLRTYDILIRSFFRIIDIAFALGSVAVLTISASPRSQRLGDMLADTTVIQTRQGRVTLKRVMNLKKLDKYTPKYPLAKRLSEEQVLYVKTVLERNRRYKNDAHKNIQKELAERLKKELDVTEKVDEKVFLETVIKDYITLSR